MDDRAKNLNIVQKPILIVQNFSGIMTALLANPGLHLIVRHISSFLDAKSLAQCRLVCKAYKRLIETDRQWLIVQLEHIHSREIRIPRIHAGLSIQILFPEWTDFTDQLKMLLDLPTFRKIVEQMWIFFEWEPSRYLANPFHKAICQSDIYFVKLMIRLGFNLELSDPDGRSPMHIACATGDLRMVQMIIDCMPRFDPTDLTDDGSTIFHFAVQHQDIQVTKLILGQFRFENARNDSGMTVFHTAVTFAPKETIEYLIQSRINFGIDIETRTDIGDTILHLACHFRNFEVVLIVSNALAAIGSVIDFDTPNEFGTTPLESSFFNKTMYDLPTALLKMFPDIIDILDHDNLHMLHYACIYNNFELLKYLYFHSEHIDVDFNVVDVNGYTPLHYACWQGHIEIVKFLIQISRQMGIDLHKESNEGFTALEFAFLQNMDMEMDIFELFGY